MTFYYCLFSSFVSHYIHLEKNFRLHVPSLSISFLPAHLVFSSSPLPFPFFHSPSVLLFPLAADFFLNFCPFIHSFYSLIFFFSENSRLEEASFPFSCIFSTFISFPSVFFVLEKIN